MNSETGSPAEARIFTGNFILLWLTNFTAFTSFYFLLATLPVYIVEVGGSEAETGFIIGVFALTALLLRPFVGRAADLWGRKRLILGGILGLGLSGALYNVTSAVPSLLGLRVFHGIGWAAFGTAAATLVADIVPPSRRGEAMGYYGISTNIAMAIGPAAGVYFQHAFGFPFLFFSSAAVALGGLLLAAFLYDPFRERGPDIEGGMVLVERTALFPSAILGMAALTYGSIVSFLPLFAAHRGIENPGLFFTVYALVVIFARGPLGRLSDIYGRGWVVVPSLISMTVGLGLLSQATGVPLFLATAFFYGVGFAGVYPALMALTVDRVSPRRRGAAMGTFTAFMDLGIGTGSFLWGVVAQLSNYSFMYLSAGAVPLIASSIYVLKAGALRASRTP